MAFGQYGDDPLHFGELSLPAGSPGSGHPVVINVHGGCWLSAYPIDHSRALARALAESGFAVWNIEYRRVGDSGGGWPGTFEDVADATDFLRKLAEIELIAPSTNAWKHVESAVSSMVSVGCGRK